MVEIYCHYDKKTYRFRKRQEKYITYPNCQTKGKCNHTISGKCPLAEIYKETDRGLGKIIEKQTN